MIEILGYAKIGRFLGNQYGNSILEYTCSLWGSFSIFNGYGALVLSYPRQPLSYSGSVKDATLFGNLPLNVYLHGRNRVFFKSMKARWREIKNPRETKSRWSSLRSKKVKKIMRRRLKKKKRSVSCMLATTKEARDNEHEPLGLSKNKEQAA